MIFSLIWSILTFALLYDELICLVFLRTSFMLCVYQTSGRLFIFPFFMFYISHDSIFIVSIFSVVSCFHVFVFACIHNVHNATFQTVHCSLCGACLMRVPLPGSPHLSGIPRTVPFLRSPLRMQVRRHLGWRSAHASL